MRNSHPTFLLVLLEATYLVKDVIRCIAKIVTKMGNFLYNLIQLNNFKLEGTLNLNYRHLSKIVPSSQFSLIP